MWQLCYRSPGCWTGDSRSTRFFQYLPANAGWTSWSGGDVSGVKCTWPFPSVRALAARSRSDCQWWSLKDRDRFHQAYTCALKTPETKTLVFKIAFKLLRTIKQFKILIHPKNGSWRGFFAEHWRTSYAEEQFYQRSAEVSLPPSPAWWFLSRCSFSVGRASEGTEWPHGVYSTVLHPSPPSPQTLSIWEKHIKHIYVQTAAESNLVTLYSDIIPGTALAYKNTMIIQFWGALTTIISGFFSMYYDNVLCAMRILHFWDIYHHNTPIYCWSCTLIILWFYHGAYMYICFGHVL